ncbi:M28 family metallopeptidase [Candidatus Poribacteria bacterium]|nr:M28 family metallopeptidase [Candidatus Poribacteria bacterium]
MKINRTHDLSYIIIINILFLFLVTSLSAYSETKLRGFTSNNATIQHQTETAFKDLVSIESCRTNLRRLTEEPHLAGTENSFKVAEFIKNQHERYGLKVKIYEYLVYLPHPLEVLVELVSPGQHVAANKETGWQWDKDSYRTDIVPGYNAYSPDGEVTAELVYVNKGLPQDYQTLHNLGISVEGKICIARYGGSYRGVKAKLAGDYGATGLILYSDPSDDGYMRGDVYPRGPWRSEDAIQRGTVKYIFQHASDPLTPGWAATEDADRLEVEEATDLPKIPVIPIAYKDAKPLLEALSGPTVPLSWQGGLPFAYHTGPGPATVHMKVKCEHKIRKIYNVIATLEGSEFPDQWVILGNHHDAWIYGAADPSSGTTSLLEIARCMGKLAQQGIRPKRTIVFASWDAEEFGILGSTEWVEHLKQELRDKTVAYLNVDISATGTKLYASAIPTLKQLVRDVSQEVIDPRTLKTVYDVWNNGHQNKKPKVGNLGSGSDHSPFVGHVGIPAVSMGFDGPYGVYHAMQDNLYWMEHFGDPTYQYQVAMAHIWGSIALRLANADVLPLDYQLYAEELLSELEILKNGSLLNIQKLRNLLIDWENSAAVLNRKLQEYIDSDNQVDIAEINQRLFQLERLLTNQDGLPMRPWFKHLIYAPGLNTGYAAVVFPGIIDAIEQQDVVQINEAIDNLASAFQRMDKGLKEIISLVNTTEED